jgi:hypothetical protein
MIRAPERQKAAPITRPDPPFNVMAIRLRHRPTAVFIAVEIPPRQKPGTDGKAALRLN